MSRSLNKAMLIGNLGNDPEIRSTTGGARVANFSVATSRAWTGRDGQQQEKTEWHRIVVWENDRSPGGGLFGVVERFLKKGDRVYVEGEIEYRSYEDKDGVTKYSTEIRARDLLMLGGKGEGGSDSAPAPQRGGGREQRAPAKRGQGGGGGAPAGGGDYDDFPSIGGDDDDLPF